MPQPLPMPPFAPGARVVVLEAEPGPERHARLEAWAREARASGAAAWVLPCHVERGGVWAGLGEWLEAILPELESRAQDLFIRHDAELAAVLPLLRRRVKPRYVTLTDASVHDEAVRNFAAERAARIGHGVIDLLDAWHTRSGGGRWVVACEDLEHAGVLVTDFFRHLLRRRGESLELVLLAAVAPGAGDRVAAELAPFAPVARARLELAPGEAEVLDPAEAARQAEALEPRARHDTLTLRAMGHEMVRLWNAAGRPDRAAEWHALLLGMLVTLGFYRDAYLHARPVRENLALFDGEGRSPGRAGLITKLQVTYITNGQPEEALRVIEEEGLARLTDPLKRAHLLYHAAMLHARFLPRRDPETAARLLQEGLDEAERADLPHEDRQFLTGFLLNGLAYVRFREGDADTAAKLSHSNYDRLERDLAPARHRLHRSVLLYNAGQVYAQTGHADEAIRFFTEAMEIDPHYSEYFNDRGNLYLKLGRVDEAEADYLRAIELSPPYPEVWFNLGQCRLRQNRPAEAEAAFLRAVDLDPARREAWANLGRLRHAQGRRAEALEAYDAALAADPNPFVLANRAAVRFELGRAEEALADLDHAVTLAPDNPALARNRAAVARTLGRAEEARAPEPALA